MAARGVFFDDDAAAAAAARLIAEGWQADLSRGRFHGEDDDEDQPWLLGTDAPDVVLELVTDEFEGWFEVDPTPAAHLTPAPLTLPAAPKRIKRPDHQHK